MKTWLIRHPRTLGVLFLIAAAFAFHESLDGARTQRRFADAKPLRAEVASVTKHSALPPRWRAEVAWRERAAPRSATLIVGTGKGWSDPGVAVGQPVEILLAADGRDPAMLASRKKSDFLRLGGFAFEATEFWFGVFFSVAALLCFVFAGRIEREAEEYLGS